MLTSNLSSREVQDLAGGAEFFSLAPYKEEIRRVSSNIDKIEEELASIGVSYENNI